MPNGATAQTIVANGGTAQIAGAADAGHGLAISGGSAVEIQTGGSLSVSSGPPPIGGPLQQLPNLGITLNDGSLHYTSSQTAALNSTISLSGPGTIDIATARFTANGVISGSGALVKDGAGTLILTSTNTYTGGTIIKAGTLQVSIGSPASLGFSGSIVGNVTNNGVFAIGRIDTYTFTGVISGIGSFEHRGSGTVILTGANTFTGGTTIVGGVVPIGTGNGILQLGNGGTTGSIVGNVVDNSVLAINRSDTYTFDGAVSGTGSFRQSGTGTTVFTAANTYGGGTVIDAGTLQLGNGGATGSIIGNVVDNGTLAINRSGSLALNGVISGTGAVTQTGTVTTTLGAANTYAGATTVNGGALLVNGSIASSSSLTVGAGATVGGTGTLPTTTINGGTLSPGDSIGTLTVNGNLTLNAGTSYAVELSPAAVDRTNVTGAAALAGTVNAAFGAGTYNSNSYTILSAAGGRTGTFAALNAANLPGFLVAGLSYTATDVLLTLTAQLAAIGTTPNQRAVGTALDNAFNAGLGLFPGIGNLTPAQVSGALDALSGEMHASLQGSLANDAGIIREALLGRLRAVGYAGEAGATGILAFGGPESYQAEASASFGDRFGDALAYTKAPVYKAPVYKAPPPGNDLTFWAQGFGSWGHWDGDGNTARLDRDLGGFLVGVDGRIGDGWRAGLATGYTRSDMRVNARASSADVDSYHIAGYASGRLGGFSLRAGAAFAWHDIDTTRTIAFPGFIDQARASYNGNTTQVFGEAGYALATGNIAVEPFGGLAWVRVETDAFREVGGAAALAGGNNSFDVGYTTLGVRLATAVTMSGGTVLVPRLTVAWQHAFDDVAPTATLAFVNTGAAFTAAGVPIARDSALINAGADLALSPRATIGIAYTGQFGENVEDHGVKGKFTWRF